VVIEEKRKEYQVGCFGSLLLDFFCALGSIFFEDKLRTRLVGRSAFNPSDSKTRHPPGDHTSSTRRGPGFQECRRQSILQLEKNQTIEYGFTIPKKWSRNFQMIFRSLLGVRNVGGFHHAWQETNTFREKTDCPHVGIDWWPSPIQ